MLGTPAGRKKNSGATLPRGWGRGPRDSEGPLHPAAPSTSRPLPDCRDLSRAGVRRRQKIRLRGLRPGSGAAPLRRAKSPRVPRAPGNREAREGETPEGREEASTTDSSDPGVGPQKRAGLAPSTAPAGADEDVKLANET